MDKSSYEIKLKDLNIWIDAEIVKVDTKEEAFVVRFGGSGV
jgi:hypothetical protein